MVDKVLVRLNYDRCDAVASILGETTIPIDAEDANVDGFEREEITNYYFILVAICHQTQSLIGSVKGKAYQGWDYLSRKLLFEASRDRGLLKPTVWKTVCPASLEKLFYDPNSGSTLSDLNRRSELIRDLGNVMCREQWSSADKLYELAQCRAATGNPNLLGLLVRFRAYQDPVKKKSIFLLGLLANSGVWSYSDAESLGPPVDYHEVRGHLRIGTIEIQDEALREKILTSTPVSESEDVVIRRAVSAAIEYIASKSGRVTSIRLHYLFWNIFRNVCLREKPHCRECPSDCGLPDRYIHLLTIRAKEPRCPFATVCASVDVEPKYLEHKFVSEWY